MIDGVDKTLEAAETWESHWRDRDKGTNFGWCGHWMRELELPEKAQRCDELAERLNRGSRDAQLLWHRAEVDLPGAYADARRCWRRTLRRRRSRRSVTS